MRNALQRVQQLREQLEALHRTTANVLAESKRLLDEMESQSSQQSERTAKRRRIPRRTARSART